MQREELIPVPPLNLIESDKKLFIRHFENRNKVEKEIYGDLSPEKVFWLQNNFYK